MNKNRFDKAFEKFICNGDDKITPRAFFDILAEIEREHVERTIELQAKIIEGKLQFEPSLEIHVQDNEIVFDNQRIVVNVS